MENYLNLPTTTKNRIIGTKYLFKNKIVNWNGKNLLCIHERLNNRCKDCKGASICEHNREKSTCKDCKGSQICMHNRRKQFCKECKGSQICIHMKVKHSCLECLGTSICKHKRNRNVCKECKGVCLCIHNRRQSYCRECNGSQFCEHNHLKSSCKECNGSQICLHNRIKHRCIECSGNQICNHNKIKRRCKICEPHEYFAHLIRERARTALKHYDNRKDKKHIMEYIGCSIDFLRNYIENLFLEGMNWDNQGEWHIDHIKPCASFNFDNEEDINKCFHYSNLQPLWAFDNISKSNKYNPNEDKRIWNGEKWI